MFRTSLRQLSQQIPRAKYSIPPTTAGFTTTSVKMSTITEVIKDDHEELQVSYGYPIATIFKVSILCKYEAGDISFENFCPSLQNISASWLLT